MTYFDVSRHACRGVVGQRQLAENLIIVRTRGKDAVRTGVKAHPAFETQQDNMLHDRRRNYAGPHCDGTRRLIVTEKLDAQADAGRGRQRGRFTNPTPGTKDTGPLTRRRGGAYQ